MAKHHLIIGGGPAATNALETIRQLEPEPSRISLISDEPAHSRMALPYWLSGDIPREHTLTGDDAYFQRLAVEAHFGVRADDVDPLRAGCVGAAGKTTFRILTPDVL